MTVEKDSEVTKVIFRKWRDKGGDIIALFPEVAVDLEGYLCDSYMHHGGHGSASYPLVVYKTRAASEKEAADLKAELERIGYVLQVRRRGSQGDVEKRLETARRWREQT